MLHYFAFYEQEFYSDNMMRHTEKVHESPVLVVYPSDNKYREKLLSQFVSGDKHVSFDDYHGDFSNLSILYNNKTYPTPDRFAARLAQYKSVDAGLTDAQKYSVNCHTFAQFMSTGNADILDKIGDFGTLADKVPDNDLDNLYDGSHEELYS